MPENSVVQYVGMNLTEFNLNSNPTVQLISQIHKLSSHWSMDHGEYFVHLSLKTSFPLSSFPFSLSFPIAFVCLFVDLLSSVSEIFLKS